MTFNTGNPIGSTDARDLSDNAENFDKALGTLDATWTDRLGVTRDSFEGRLAKGSFYRVGDFTTGYTLTNMRQTLEYDGHEYSWAGAFPKVVAAGATPETSGGIGVGAWVDRTDVSIRSELITPGGFGLIGSFSSYASLQSSSALPVGSKVHLLSWRDDWAARGDSPDGGGIFVVTSDTSSSDDGGTICVNLSGQRLKRICDGSEDASIFGVVFDYDPATQTGTDCGALLQKAIDAGYGRLRGKVGTTSQIILSKKFIKSDEDAPYYGMMQYYGATKGDFDGSAIVAMTGFDTTKSLVKTALPATSKCAAKISGITLEAAGIAKYALEHDYTGYAFRDRKLKITDVLLSGATSHGLYAGNVIAMRGDNIASSACNGFGLYFYAGVTDSYFAGTYVRTSNGGLHFGDGCIENQFFGGKLEDLYTGNAIHAVGSWSGKIDIHGVSMVNNNINPVYCSGSTEIRLFGCNIADPKFTGLSGIKVDNGGTVRVRDTRVSGFDYCFNADTGTIYDRDNQLSATTNVATVANGGRVSSDKRTKSVNIAASSSGTVTFEGMLPALSGAFAYAQIPITAIYNQYAQTPSATQSFVGVLNIGYYNGTYGVSLITTKASDVNYIASITASITNTSSIVITINTGATIGSGSGNKLFNIYLGNYS